MADGDTSLATNPQVVCTELEEGAVLLNMETRLYYSLNDTALDLWKLVGETGGGEELARVAAERFEGDESAVRATAFDFVAELEREGLVVPGQPAGSSRPVGERRPFTAPELVKHDEPLHEVATSPHDPQLPLAE